MKVTFSNKARKDLTALSRKASERVIEKIEWYARQEKPLSFAKRLHCPGKMLFRFRIGNYRAIFRLEGRTLEIIFVLTVKHRKEVYSDLSISISYVPSLPPEESKADAI